LFLRGNFMTQIALTSQAGLHVAVIMDGNGRWATARGLPRTAGHVRGAEAVRRTVEAAPDLGIRTLSLYAFSSDNWRRPTGEVRGADGAPDVDLVVRTGGEQRLSDFLLWECAYAELYFTPRAWPDFDREDLAAAVADFRGRTRRFGDIAAATDAYSAGRA